MERKRLTKNKPNLNLTTMSLRELKQLQAKVNFLINNSVEDIDDSNYHTFYDLLTTKLDEVLKTSYQSQPFPVFKKQKQQYNKLIELVDYLDGLIRGMFAKPKKIYYRRMYRMYISLVIGEIQDSPIPLSLSVVVNYKSQFPAILDNNFPGYLENGLFKVIFTRNLKNLK